ncbi:MAG: hypothetical protein AAF570_14390, partial [Bacteroidota bacterium]
MQNRKLYHLLGLLTEADQDRFTDFLASPYHNGSRMLVIFWDRWRAMVIEGGNGGEVTPEALIEGTKMKRSRFDKLCSQCYQKAREFLALRRYEMRSELEDQLFVGAVLERDPGLQAAHRFVPQEIQAVDKMPNAPEKNLGQFVLRSELTEAQIRARKTEKEWTKVFLEMLHALDNYSEAKKLQLLCGAVNVGQIFRGNVDEALAPAINNALDSPLSEEADALLHIYQSTLALLVGKAPDTAFTELLQRLETHRGDMASGVVRDLHGYLLNHCIRQINRGNDIFLQHTHALYVHLLDNGDLLHEGRLSPQQFKNIVALSCRIGRLDWAEHFIQQYLPLLADDHGGIAQTYNAAVLRF